MADMVFRPAFVDVDSEREVVLEEIAMVEDTPNDLVHDIAAEAVFGAHPLGRPVIGTRRRDLERLAAGARRLSPPCLPGRTRSSSLPRETSATTSSSRCSTSAATARLRARGLAARKPARANGTPGVRFQRKDTEQYHVCLSAPGISRLDERRFAASLMDAIVGGSASSRLFQEIREKRGMAYSVYSYSSQYADAGQIGVYVGTREDNLAECLEIAVAELSDIARGNVRADELARAKENLKGRILLSLESTSARMTRLGKSTVTDTPLLDARGDREAPRGRHRRARSPSSPTRSSRRSGSRSPESARTRAASPTPCERVNPALLDEAA